MRGMADILMKTVAGYEVDPIRRGMPPTGVLSVTPLTSYISIHGISPSTM